MVQVRATFTAESRRAMLDEFHALGERLDATQADATPKEADSARYGTLRRSYREQLPQVAVARCPFTKQVYTHSLDTFGIDGPWWDCRSTNRPLELMMQGTVVAFTGALKLALHIERAPFLAKPGPGVPFVVPRLLRRDGVRAVLMSLPIGEHTGYAVTYFADPVPSDLEGFNDWGTDYYQFDDGLDQLGWHQASQTEADYDFNLAPYLKSGALLWIAPDDTALTLREGTTGCPYVDLEGPRVPQLVQDGDRWFGEYALDDYLEIEPDDEPTVALPRDASPEAPPPRTESPQSAVPPKAAPLSCASCGDVLKPTSKFCPSCGKPAAATASTAAAVAPAANVCQHCGQPRRPGAKFCGRCGKA